MSFHIGNPSVAAIDEQCARDDFKHAEVAGSVQKESVDTKISPGSEPCVSPDDSSSVTTPAPPKANVAGSINIGPRHFELLKLIGEGAFGKVIMVRNILDGQLYAMKAISKKVLRKKNNIAYMKSERDILTKVDHPFIVKLWFAFQTDQRLFLVMDFLGGGELFFHLKRRGLILEAECRVYVAEMVLAIEFLHNMGVVHRDLKPENVLLRPNGHICITDFGLAKEVGDNSQVRTLCGTSEYMAPEMLLRNGYTKAVDWWSLGALFYEMLAGKPPFVMKRGESQKDLDKKIISQKISVPGYLHSDTASILKGLLEKDSLKRLGSSKTTMFAIGGVTALKAHPFFQDLNWRAVLNCELEPPINPLQVKYTDGDTKSVATYSGAAQATTPVKGDDASAFSPNGMSNPAEHFHAEFTNQQLSPSFIDDSLSAGTSECNTPTLSRSGSKENLVGLEADERAKSLREKEDKAYCDFSYVQPAFTCTQEQVDSFHVLIADKLARASAKKIKQEKKEAGRAAKEKEETAREAARLLALQQAADEARRKKQAEVAAEQAKAEQMGRWRERVATLSRKKQVCEQYAVDFDAASKKVKATQRKLRGVLELQARVDSGELALQTLSGDQMGKLGRRSSLETELSAEEAELGALERAHQAAYLGVVALTAEEAEELQSLQGNIERGGELPPTQKANAAMEIEAQRERLKQLRDAEDEAESLIDAAKEKQREEAASEKLRAEQASVRAESTFGSASLKPQEKKVEAAAVPVPLAKYIPVHLRAGGASTVSPPAAPPAAPASSFVPLAPRWGRPMAGSTALNAFKDAPPLTPTIRSSSASSSVDGDEYRTASSSLNCTPTNFYSAQGTPTHGIGMQAAAKEFVPAFLRTTAPTLHEAPDPSSLAARFKAQELSKASSAMPDSGPAVSTSVPASAQAVSSPAPKSWASLVKKC
jgi:serine/threonine protein kinase